MKILRGLVFFLCVVGLAFATPEEVFQRTKKLAEAGDAKSQASLGHMYDFGRGVPKDDAEAVKWYRKSAEQGNDDAQYYLGVMYFIGRGVIKDLVEAHAWWNVAGAKGNKGARERRNTTEQEMTREQIAEATKLAKVYFEKFGKK